MLYFVLMERFEVLMRDFLAVKNPEAARRTMQFARQLRAEGIIGRRITDVSEDVDITFSQEEPTPLALAINNAFGATADDDIKIVALRDAIVEMERTPTDDSQCYLGLRS